MSEIVVTEVFEVQTVATNVVEVQTPVVEVIEIALQGPQGIQGIPGIGIADAFVVANRLSELTTAQMKIEARTNLELNHIDLGEFL